MVREVTHDADGPYVVDEEEFEEQDQTIAVCQCGLSDNKPFCDGSHQVTADEEEGVVYKYQNDDADGEQTVVGDD